MRLEELMEKLERIKKTSQQLKDSVDKCVEMINDLEVTFKRLEAQIEEEE